MSQVFKKIANNWDISGVLAVVCLIFVSLLCKNVFGQNTANFVGTSGGASKVSAFVLGNNDYDFHPLKTAANDADDIAYKLNQFGFTVVSRKNLSLSEMKIEIDGWISTLSKNSIAVFYFSGHGITYNGENYIIPKDNVAIMYRKDIPKNSMSITSLNAKIARSGCPTRIFILDACRNDPLPDDSRGISPGGFVRTDVVAGTFIAFAARFGETASDKHPNGRNGLFTGELLSQINSPNRPIQLLFGPINEAVVRYSNETQHPQVVDELTRPFCFVGSCDILQSLQISARPFSPNDFNGRTIQALAQAIESERKAGLSEADIYMKFANQTYTIAVTVDHVETDDSVKHANLFVEKSTAQFDFTLEKVGGITLRRLTDPDDRVQKGETVYCTATLIRTQNGLYFKDGVIAFSR